MQREKKKKYKQIYKEKQTVKINKCKYKKRDAHRHKKQTKINNKYREDIFKYSPLNIYFKTKQDNQQ